jgi:hypothetical protein
MEPGWKEHLASVADPRDARGVRHRLDEMLTMVILGVICGAEDCEGIADFGHAKEGWLRSRGA